MLNDILHLKIQMYGSVNNKTAFVHQSDATNAVLVTT